MMRFTVLTLFPQMFAPVQESILKRAQQAGLINIQLINFRDHAVSKHKNVDDVPYGGGLGMVLKPEPIFAAWRALPEAAGVRKTVLLSPQGRVFRQSIADELSKADELVLICGHYEGFDERIRMLADDEISLGDYVLTGGELAAMVVIDAVARLLPGVLGESASAEDESHRGGLLEYPQYTRPSEYAGMPVPEILLSGHHANIARWRNKEAWRRTFLRRPDLIPALLNDAELVSKDYAILEELAWEEPLITPYREHWQYAQPPVSRRKRKMTPDRIEAGNQIKKEE